MTGPLVWTQASFENTDQFIHELSISDKSEIKDALTAFKSEFKRLCVGGHTSLT